MFGKVVLVSSGTAGIGKKTASVSVLEIDTGGIRTELARHLGSFVQLVLYTLFYDVLYEAITQLYAGTMPNGKYLNGKYLIPWARIGKPYADTQDPGIGKKLWEYLEDQVENI